MQLIIIKLLYSILLLPLALIRILIKSIKNPAYRDRVSERFGIVNKNINKDFRADIWFHAVSVGEFIALKPLILELIKIKPDYKILITATTPTGSKLIIEFINKLNNKQAMKIQHCYYPYDLSFFCRSFISSYKPKLAVFMETEIWPKMFNMLDKKNIKLFIINARLSDKSYKNYTKYKIIKEYIFKIIKKVDYIAAQTKSDLDNFIKIGADNKKIKVLGNIKYNIALPDDLGEVSNYYKNILVDNNQFVFIAASTHRGEDEIILEIYNNLINKYNKKILLILVPRHPERTADIYSLCEKIKYKNNNLNIIKYSEILANPSTVDASSRGLHPNSLENSYNINKQRNIDIFIVDTIGKLLYFYNMVDLAFIGGSLVESVGGHNPLETAILKVSSIIGPNYYNFTDIVKDLIKHHALIIAKDKHDLETQILNLIDNKERRISIGNAAYNSIIQQDNIINKYLDLILD